jgi:hypothetical protein
LHKVDRLLTHHNALRIGLGHPEVTHDAIMGELSAVAAAVLPYMDRVWKVLDDKRRSGERILFEGAQGTLLDIDHGTYPYVTSSHTVAGQAAAGSGVGPGAIGYVLGITKAYTTRVGEGPFPTEQDNEVGEFLGTQGHEFGTVTGRKRRCGWFDAVLVRQAVAVNGINGVALTKLDVLDGMDEIKVCTKYRLDGEEIDYLPASQAAQARVEPVYETLEGWKGTTAGARSWNDSACAGSQICPLCRRADRRSGRIAFNQSGTGRHDTCDGPVSRPIFEPASLGIQPILAIGVIRSGRMADFVAVLKKTLDGLGEPSPEMRQRVYERARTTVLAKLDAITPPPPQAVADRQIKALEDAIAAIEREFAPPPKARPAGRTRGCFCFAERSEGSGNRSTASPFISRDLAAPDSRAGPSCAGYHRRAPRQPLQPPRPSLSADRPNSKPVQTELPSSQPRRACAAMTMSPFQDVNQDNREETTEPPRRRGFGKAIAAVLVLPPRGRWIWGMAQQGRFFTAGWADAACGCAHDTTPARAQPALPRMWRPLSPQRRQNSRRHPRPALMNQPPN